MAAARIELSKRLPKDLTPSPFFEELEKTKKIVAQECAAGTEKTGENVVGNGMPLIDMTVSSPVRVGLPVELDSAVDEARKQFGNWSPDASGWREAREAVAAYYRERGGVFTPNQVIVTASTSEAYSVLFKTFCDPGDVILTPMPGYPLLDTLAQLEHLECTPYFLKLVREKPQRTLSQLKAQVVSRESKAAQTSASQVTVPQASAAQFRFVLDTDSLLAAPERARILLLVSPHNPTGHMVSLQEWNEVVRFCEENNLVLVVDEVFGDYGFSDEVKRSWRFLRREDLADHSGLDENSRSPVRPGMTAESFTSHPREPSTSHPREGEDLAGHFGLEDNSRSPIRPGMTAESSACHPREPFTSYPREPSTSHPRESEDLADHSGLEDNSRSPVKPGMTGGVKPGMNAGVEPGMTAEEDFFDCGGNDVVFAPKNGPKCPIFWLNGLSKAVGAPQLKFGWMAFYAPREKFEEIRAALEFVEDAYLSTSSCAQALAAPLLANSAQYECLVRERLLANWKTLQTAFPSKYCPKVLGGWYAVLHLGDDDEELTLRLLREKHVLVQPGFFFDFDEDGWIVISLLQEPAVFAEAIRRMSELRQK
ncbi:MAG: pyridoxal phosphate-dependent aminotransferase [Fibrobacter sp.]|nr:pyridoxal phosphate-dependent aminotransferase [Fibrobacter sp.]